MALISAEMSWRELTDIVSARACDGERFLHVFSSVVFVVALFMRTAHGFRKILPSASALYMCLRGRLSRGPMAPVSAVMVSVSVHLPERYLSASACC